MSEDERIALSRYRLEKALDVLESAKIDLHAQKFASANNRAYYSIFHCMRAVLAMDSADFKKHSAVIAKFNQYYVKTGCFPRTFGQIIANASIIRTRSDYEDFYVCSISDTEQLVSDAETFYNSVHDYLESRYQTTS